MSKSPEVTELLEASLNRESAGDFAMALQLVSQALELAQTRADPEESAACLARLAWVYYRLGHYAEARALAEQALGLSAPASTARADAWIALGACAMETGALEEVERFMLQAADLCREIGYQVSRQRALHNLAAGVYTLRGQFDLALATYEEAYRLACELDSPHQYSCLSAMGYLLQSVGQYPRARAVLHRVQNIDSIPVLYRGYIFMIHGMIELGEANLDEASSWFARSRAIAEAVGDPALNIFLRLGESQHRRQAGEAAAALEWAQDAVSWAGRAGNQRILGRALIERGLAHWHNLQFSAAEADFLLAAENLQQRQQLYDLARATFFLAALLHAQNRPSATAAWKEAAARIVAGGYGMILDMERRLAYPLLAGYLGHPDSALAELSARCLEHLQKVPPPPLRVVALGNLSVWQGSRQVNPALLRKRRAGELLILLLLSPSRAASAEAAAGSSYTARYDQVAEALWPEKDASSSQMLFHQATSALRRALEPDLPGKFPSRYLSVEEGALRLQLPAGSSVDFQQFEEHLRRGEWELAATIYTGDFLPELLYADWTTAPRQRLAQLYERALLKHASQQFTDGNYEPALTACQRLLEREPWHEQATLLGMRACLALHDRSGALLLYRNLARALQAEFGLQPPPEIQAVYQQITGSD